MDGTPSKPINISDESSEEENNVRGSVRRRGTPARSVRGGRSSRGSSRRDLPPPVPERQFSRLPPTQHEALSSGSEAPVYDQDDMTSDEEYHPLQSISYDPDMKPYVGARGLSSTLKKIAREVREQHIDRFSATLLRQDSLAPAAKVQGSLLFGVFDGSGSIRERDPCHELWEYYMDSRLFNYGEWRAIAGKDVVEVLAEWVDFPAGVSHITHVEERVPDTQNQTASGTSIRQSIESRVSSTLHPPSRTHHPGSSNAQDQLVRPRHRGSQMMQPPPGRSQPEGTKTPQHRAGLSSPSYRSLFHEPEISPEHSEHESSDGSDHRPRRGATAERDHDYTPQKGFDPTIPTVSSPNIIVEEDLVPYRRPSRANPSGLYVDPKWDGPK